MMRSRALPDDFDFARSLQAGCRERWPSSGPDFSYEELILANNDGATLTLSQKHRAPVSNVTASASDGLPSAGAATGLLDSSPPLSTNEELRYSDSHYSGTGSRMTIAPQFTDPYSRSNIPSAGSLTQRQGRLSRPLSVGRLKAEPLASPSSVMNAYNYGAGSSSAVIHNQAFSSNTSPLESPSRPLHDQGLAPYSPCAALPVYSHSTSLRSLEVATDAGERSQEASLKRARPHLSPWSLQTNALPSAHSNAFGGDEQTDNFFPSLQREPGPDTELEMQSSHSAMDQATTDPSYRSRRGNLYPMYYNQYR